MATKPPPNMIALKRAEEAFLLVMRLRHPESIW